MWSGTITTEVSTSSFIVDAWAAVFNATGETPSGAVTFYLGHILVYEKTPVLSFANIRSPGGNAPGIMWDKNLKEIEWLSTGFSAVSGMMTKLDLNNDIADEIDSVSPSGVEHTKPLVTGMHKGFTLETVFFAESSFSMRNVTYHVEHTKGKLNG